MTEQPSAARHRLGEWGEHIAARFLEQRGYRILARNVRIPGIGEADIVAQDGNTLVLVEVRTRQGGPPFAAEDSVGPRKRARLARLATAIAYHREWTGPLRVDLVAISIAPNGRVDSIHLWKDVIST